MKVNASHNDMFLIHATREEVRILKDVVLNLDNDMEDDEMSTRVGATRPEVRKLLEDLLLGLRA